MPSAPLPSPPPAVEPEPASGPGMQRTTGALRLAFKQTDRGAALETLYQRGAARVRFPRVPPGTPPEAVLINTAGGLTGGDRMDIYVRVGPDAHATVSAQASEKIYRASEGRTVIRNRIDVGADASIEWLPQETIVFDGASLDRTLEVSVRGAGEALLSEAVVFGRTAMGETFRRGRFLDRWRVRRDGDLVFAEGTSVEGDLQARLGHPLALDGGCAYATLLWISPTAEALLEPVRSALGIGRIEPDAAAFGTQGGAQEAARVGASAWDGLLLVRMAASDGAGLRMALERALEALRRGRAVPTVWRC